MCLVTAVILLTGALFSSTMNVFLFVLVYSSKDEKFEQNHHRGEPLLNLTLKQPHQQMWGERARPQVQLLVRASYFIVDFPAILPILRFQHEPPNIKKNVSFMSSFYLRFICSLIGFYQIPTLNQKLY